MRRVSVTVSQSREIRRWLWTIFYVKFVHDFSIFLESNRIRNCLMMTNEPACQGYSIAQSLTSNNMNSIFIAKRWVIIYYTVKWEWLQVPATPGDMKQSTHPLQDGVIISVIASASGHMELGLRSEVWSSDHRLLHTLLYHRPLGCLHNFFYMSRRE